MTIHFTSDTHFGHKNIIKYAERPFEDVTHMNEMLVHNWNEVVHPDDTVYHLGDVALGPIRESLAYISRLNGTKVLITGNHDRNFHLGKRSAGLEPFEWDEEYRQAGFDAVYPQLALWGFKGLPTVNLSHFPYTGDSHDGDRYEEARLADKGIPLLHGHTHSTGDPVTWSADRKTIQIHVGVDAWGFRPVSQHEVARLLEEHLTDA